VQAQSFFVERAKLIPLEPGIGWGTYTREGFVQLMIAAGLTLGLLVVLPALTRLETASAQRLFQGGSSALIALTLVVLATAANRLLACEEAYGFSVTRVFGHVFAFRARRGAAVARGHAVGLAAPLRRRRARRSAALGARARRHQPRAHRRRAQRRASGAWPRARHRLPRDVVGRRDEALREHGLRLLDAAVDTRWQAFNFARRP